MYHTTNPYPVIRESDYPSFVALPVIGLDPTYEEWIAKQQAANLSRERAGERRVPVPVNLSEFVRFCEGRNKPIVAQYLLHYAFERAPQRR